MALVSEDTDEEVDEDEDICAHICSNGHGFYPLSTEVILMTGAPILFQDQTLAFEFKSSIFTQTWSL